MSLVYVSISLTHDDWPQLTSKLTKDIFQANVLNSIPLSDRLKQVVYFKSSNRDILKNMLNNIKKHNRVIKFYLKELKYSKKYFYAIVEMEAKIDGSITRLLLQNNVIMYRESIYEGIENWEIVLDPDYLKSLLDKIKETAIIYKTYFYDFDRILDKFIHNNTNLTSRELEVLRLAYLRGFFDYPKRSNSIEISEELGISKSAFSQELRRALKKIIKSYIEFIMEGK
ncbi:MAG: helix-turn-helix domain-containing protein [Sulfolobaceae archaeon]